MATLEELLAPVSDESPTGEDLDDTDQFEALRTSFDIRFPIDVGLSDIEEGRELPPAVDWEAQITLIEELSGQTKDLFLAASLARCGIAADDLDAVERGLLMMAGLLETYWDSVHPQLDTLGYIGRKGICEQIAGRSAFAMPFLNVTILGEGRASFKAEQIMAAEAQGATNDDYGAIKRLVENWDDERKQAVADRLQFLSDTIKRIDTVMRENAEGQEPPGFDTTLDYIGTVKSAYVALAELKAEVDEQEEGKDSEDYSESPQAASGGKPLSGEIRSRDDVLRALRAIEQYYERAEPGHPLKFASRRLAGWVTKDFMEILHDIVPNSVDGAKEILFERPKEDD